MTRFIIPILEFLLPLKRLELVRSGIIDDLMHSVDIYKIARNDGVLSLIGKDRSQRADANEAARGK